MNLRDNIFLTSSWKLKRMYQKAFCSTAGALELTQGEIDVLLFLFYHKPLDTAKDIVEYRSISKSMVSKSVDSLIKKGYLSCQPDSVDKRNIHLLIQPAADRVVETLVAVQKEFFQILFSDITEEEYAVAKKILTKINNNISNKFHHSIGVC